LSPASGLDPASSKRWQQGARCRPGCSGSRAFAAGRAATSSLSRSQAFSTDLSDNTADLKILFRMTKLTVQPGPDAIPTFTAACVRSRQPRSHPPLLPITAAGAFWACGYPPQRGMQILIVSPGVQRSNLGAPDCSSSARLQLVDFAPPSLAQARGSSPNLLSSPRSCASCSAHVRRVPPRVLVAAPDAKSTRNCRTPSLNESAPSGRESLARESSRTPSSGPSPERRGASVRFAGYLRRSHRSAMRILHPALGTPSIVALRGASTGGRC
jgi:hypothetical protein